MVSHAISLDKGKSILSKDRAQDWGADDAFEDGYLENRAMEEKGYESDPADKAEEISSEPHCQTFSAKEVTGLGGQLTGGRANRTLNHLGVNLCQTRSIRSH